MHTDQIQKQDSTRLLHNFDKNEYLQNTKNKMFTILVQNFDNNAN